MPSTAPFDARSQARPAPETLVQPRAGKWRSLPFSKRLLFEVPLRLPTKAVVAQGVGVGAGVGVGSTGGRVSRVKERRVTPPTRSSRVTVTRWAASRS